MHQQLTVLKASSDTLKSLSKSINDDDFLSGIPDEFYYDEVGDQRSTLPNQFSAVLSEQKKESANMSLYSYREDPESRLESEYTNTVKKSFNCSPGQYIQIVSSIQKSNLIDKFNNADLMHLAYEQGQLNSSSSTKQSFVKKNIQMRNTPLRKSQVTKSYSRLIESNKIHKQNNSAFKVVADVRKRSLERTSTSFVQQQLMKGGDSTKRKLTCDRMSYSQTSFSNLTQSQIQNSQRKRSREREKSNSAVPIEVLLMSAKRSRIDSTEKLNATTVCTKQKDLLASTSQSLLNYLMNNSSAGLRTGATTNKSTTPATPRRQNKVRKYIQSSINKQTVDKQSESPIKQFMKLSSADLLDDVDEKDISSLDQRNTPDKYKAQSGNSPSKAFFQPRRIPSSQLESGAQTSRPVVQDLNLKFAEYINFNNLQQQQFQTTLNLKDVSNSNNHTSIVVFDAKEMDSHRTARRGQVRESNQTSFELKPQTCILEQRQHINTYRKSLKDQGTDID